MNYRALAGERLARLRNKNGGWRKLKKGINYLADKMANKTGLAAKTLESVFVVVCDLYIYTDIANQSN